MLIEIRCRNFSNFDAALGRYVECGETAIVPDDQVGQFVVCKKCHQQVEVLAEGDSNHSDSVPAATRPAATRPAAKKPGSAVDVTRTKKRRSVDAPKQNPRAGKTRSSPAGKKTGKTPGSGTTPGSGKTPGNRSRTKAKQRSAAAIGVQKPDLMSMDLAEQHVSSTLARDRVIRCRKCGNAVENGQCTVCKYVEPKFEKLFQPLDEIEIELAGFQRWFCQTMNEGVSTKAMEYAVHGMLAMLFVFLLIAAVLGMAGFGIGRWGGVLLLVSVCVAATAYAGFIYKGHQFLHDPTARLAWFQKPFWNLMLWFSRAMKWQNYDGRLKDRKIIKVREKQFGDRDIVKLEGIKACQVLDLEGTSVTDVGLLDLYDLKQLRCLVLKRTKVSHEAVFRLQQSFPKLWIWN